MVKFLHFVNRKKRFFSLNNSLIIMWLYVEWFCLKPLRQVLSHQPLPLTKANPIVVYIHVMKGGGFEDVIVSLFGGYKTTLTDDKVSKPCKV